VRALACGTRAWGAALDPPRAHGDPVAPGGLRARPEDFQVEEDLGFAPSGAGPHLLLKVRKIDANTQWVARELARLAGCKVRDVGYAGLKDRRAVAVQWFSVPRPPHPVDWPALATGELEVLEAHSHTRKLPRGALAGNRFVVRIGAPGGDAAALDRQIAPRLAEIAQRGVPNYFGPQRFGRDGANLARTESGPARLARGERGFVLSAARSALFNAVLAERVATGSWHHLRPGDVASLDGRGSLFPVTAPDEALAGRCERLEIHPTGPLWGTGSPASSGAVLELESRVAAELARESALCVAAGMRQERRALRLAVRDLRCQAEERAVRLSFYLTRGGFATSVLRELIEPAGADVPSEPQLAASNTYTAPVPPSTGRAET
jgi:tRNA pseudouridine13 synthase